MLARVFNQDVYNLPKVQAGLETGAIDTVTFANYQETKPRHFHRLLERVAGPRLNAVLARLQADLIGLKPRQMPAVRWR